MVWKDERTPAVSELLADKTAREAFRRSPEVRAECEHAPIDAGLDFALEEWRLAERRLTQLPTAGPVIPPHARLEARHRRLHDRVGAVDARRAQ